MPVLGAVSPFLEPFLGNLSPTIDKVSEELTLRYPHEGPCVASRNVKRFRGGLVFEAHRLVFHLTLGSRVIKKKKNRSVTGAMRRVAHPSAGARCGAGAGCSAIKY